MDITKYEIILCGKKISKTSIEIKKYHRHTQQQDS